MDTKYYFSKVKEMKQRQYYLDNACAVLIVNMIFFNHQTTFCEYTNPVISFIGFILSFYMAWFFFKAGMMFKERPIKTVVRNSAKRLLIPYMFFTFMGLVITACQEFFLEANNPLTIGFLKDEFWWLINWSTLFPSMACWFLLSLFVVRVVYVSLPRNRLPPQVIIGLTLVLGWLVYIMSVKNELCYPLAIGSHHFQFHVPFYFGNMFHGLAFYALGSWLREKQFAHGVFIVSMMIFLGKFFFPASMDFRANDTGGSNYFLCVIYELSGCVVINNIFKYVANKPIKIFSHVGQNSMVYYLTHYPFMKIICYFFYAPFALMAGGVRYTLLSGILMGFLLFSDFVFRIKVLRKLVGN